MSDDNGTFSSVEDLFAEVERRWEALPWWKRAYLKLSAIWIRYRPRHFTRGVKHRYQRMRYGVSERDTWNFYHYLARVTDLGLEHLRTRELGFPVGLTWEEWDDTLATIQHGMRQSIALDHLDDEEAQEQAEEDFNKAIQLLHEYWFDLWD